ncbi:ion channel [Zhihengliuella halotolerans]|uniref:Ion channel n=1 Tax=Zhihengliuella halotolerans TaxID=370736 RepID=A0A4V2GAB7_9MICC|nr:ion channel [Zhihengliuella halotolerans]RZU63606.1 ion channel [Zhihengliuella halotolerans]
MKTAQPPRSRLHRFVGSAADRLIARIGLRGSLALMLAFAVVLQFGYPATLHGELWTGLYMALYGGMLFFALLIVHEQGRGLLPFVVLGAVSTTIGIVYSFNQHNATVTVIMLFAVALFMGAIIGKLGVFLFRRQRADGLSLILAALTIYVILGGFFGAVYAGIEQLAPGSFVDPLTPDASPAWPQLVYFSYVTMSTVGYGDILATTAWSRSLVTFHGVGATLYLTIVVARLVGIWSSSNHDEHTPAPGPAASS